MKKSYSQLNILQERLSGVGQAKGLIQAFFSNKKHITVEIPYYDYLRGIVFIRDLYDNFGEEIRSDFDMSSLVYLLYTDFLTQMKKDATNQEVANYLIVNKEKFFGRKATRKKVMKEVSKNLFSFDTILEHEEEGFPDDNDQTAFLTFRARESDIYRGEILLYDLSAFLKDTLISVEELIAILYLDFLENIKAKGNCHKTQRSIVAHLKRF